METTYFNIDTRRVQYGADVAERASGGADRLYYAHTPTRETGKACPKGQVVNMEEYRRAHAPVEELPSAAPKKGSGRAERRLSWIGLALDLLATAGILLLVVGVLIKLFAL